MIVLSFFLIFLEFLKKKQALGSQEKRIPNRVQDRCDDAQMVGLYRESNLVRLTVPAVKSHDYTNSHNTFNKKSFLVAVVFSIRFNV